MPVGRGGLVLGSSPLGRRSVQSPKYLNGTLPSSPARRLIIHSPVCPEETRRIQASSPDLNSPKADAIDIVHALTPGLLGDVGGNFRCAAEVLGRRNLEQGEPVKCRVVMRCRSL